MAELTMQTANGNSHSLGQLAQAARLLAVANLAHQPCPAESVRKSALHFDLLGPCLRQFLRSQESLVLAPLGIFLQDMPCASTKS